MVAFRQVFLPLPETRAADYLLLNGDWYQVLAWSISNEVRANQILPHRVELKACNTVAARVQKVDIDQDDGGVNSRGKPITILVGRADALPVMVRTDQ